MADLTARKEKAVEENKIEMWAVIELMGHGQTAGLIRTSDLGGLLRVDVPVEDGFHTEYYGEAAIYSIKIVSEEIARAYAAPERGIYIHDEPIVPRAQYEEALHKSREHIHALEMHIDRLSRQLTAVAALPAGDDEHPYDWEDQQDQWEQMDR